MSDIERRIRLARALRIVFAALAVVNGVTLAADLALDSPVAAVPAACILAMLLLVIVETRMIGTLRARERELSRPRMTPEDYRRLREMERELGWEPTELPPGMAEPAPGFAERAKAFEGFIRLTAAGSVSMASLSGSGTLSAKVISGTCTCPPGACAPVGGRIYLPGGAVIRCCAACGKRIILEGEDASLPAPMTGPGGRWRPLSELPGTRQGDGEPEGIPAEALIEGMRRELEAGAPGHAAARAAAEHFAALARVGRESCIGFCPICAERDHR